MRTNKPGEWLAFETAYGFGERRIDLVYTRYAASEWTKLTRPFPQLLASRPALALDGANRLRLVWNVAPIIEQMLLISDNVSDLNFSCGQKPQVEINGTLYSATPLGMGRLTAFQTEMIAMSILRGNPDAGSAAP